MADNVTITNAANSTPPAGTVIATDDVGSAHYQVVKVALGLDGAVDTHRRGNRTVVLFAGTGQEAA